jgi:hypothetical protein
MRSEGSGQKEEQKGGGRGKCGCCQPTPEDIARRAYELWLSSGATPGHDVDDWLDAERELAKERHGHRQAAAA